jgi:hypothetical protein
MVKIHILTTCEHCNGQAYLPTGEDEDDKGRKYTHYTPCPMCEGTGTKSKWVSLPDFLNMLKDFQCKHEHTSYQGSMHFSAGDVWDDIEEVCNDCGAHLD